MLEDARHLPVIGPALARARVASLDVPPERLRHETVRRVINQLASDLATETRRRLQDQHPADAAAVRALAAPVVGFTAAMADANRAIKEFLFAHMYRHWQVNRMSNKARRVTEQLFTLLAEDVATLPDEWRGRAGQGHPQRAALAVCDYVASMTDRFALDEYKRLTDLGVPG